MCSVYLASALDGGLGSIVVHVHSSGFNPAGGSSHDNCRRPFPLRKTRLPWCWILSFFGKGIEHRNIDQNQPKWRIFDFCILCHVPCIKNVGFLGFSLLIFVVASVSPNGHSRRPWDPASLSDEERLGKVEAPTASWIRISNLRHQLTELTPVVFFFPFVWRFSNLPKNYKIFVFHLKNGAWGAPNFFLRKPIFSGANS